MLSTYFNWFSPKLRLENSIDGVSTIKEIINIPVLLTKIVLVSIFAFFIVFCFRQYSIYKHLAFVNQQRKTAFDSYLLFHAAIGEKDTEATKSLLMSLAKTIHETINSGFLSSKGLNQPLVQNIDLGKIQS